MMLREYVGAEIWKPAHQAPRLMHHFSGAREMTISYQSKPMPALTPKLARARHGALYWCILGLFTTIILVAGLLSMTLNAR